LSSQGSVGSCGGRAAAAWADWAAFKRHRGSRGRLSGTMRSPIRKAEKNVLRKLAQRELSRKGNRTFDRSSAQEKFRGYELCVRLPFLSSLRVCCLPHLVCCCSVR